MLCNNGVGHILTEYFYRLNSQYNAGRCCKLEEGTKHVKEKQGLSKAGEGRVARTLQWARPRDSTVSAQQSGRGGYTREPTDSAQLQHSEICFSENRLYRFLIQDPSCASRCYDPLSHPTPSKKDVEFCTSVSKYILEVRPWFVSGPRWVLPLNQVMKAAFLYKENPSYQGLLCFQIPADVAASQEKVPIPWKTGSWRRNYVLESEVTLTWSCNQQA